MNRMFLICLGVVAPVNVPLELCMNWSLAAEGGSRYAWSIEQLSALSATQNSTIKEHQKVTFKLGKKRLGIIWKA